MNPADSRHEADAANVSAAGRGRPGGLCKELAGLLCRAEEGQGSRGDAFVRAGRSWVWPAAHQVADHGMAAIGRNVAGDDRDDFGVVRQVLSAEC